MDRRHFLLQATGWAAAGLALTSCRKAEARPNGASMHESTDLGTIEPLRKSDAEWRDLLPADSYAVLFEEGESFTRADFSLDAWLEPPLNGSPPIRTRGACSGDS